jgi:stringent starvation protein B
MTNEKREVLEKLLKTGGQTVVQIVFDARPADVKVPEWHKKNPALVLNLSLNFPSSTFSMAYEEHTLELGVTFNGVYTPCSVPWKRIFCVRSENIGAMLWVEDQPKDVAAQPREEPREERRKRALHAVSAIEDDQGAWGDGEVAPEVHAVAKVVETVARPALRLVKPEDMN